MKIFCELSNFIGRYMAIIAAFVTVSALFYPNNFLWIKTDWINYLLMLVMFGMGLTLDFNSFKSAFSRPKYIIIGCLAQFIIMPVLAYGLSLTFALNSALMAGVILVGTCPGGTASNVMTYLSRGDSALSIAMTSINTLLAPLLTPILTYIFLRKTVNVNITAIFLSIMNVVIVPVFLGLVINKFFAGLTREISVILPAISVIAICMILACVVANNSAKILSLGAGVIFLVVILHNLLGYFCGFMLGKILHMDRAKIKALSIEVGMQNSGLAVSLAGSAFPDLVLAAVPGALFSAWHNISGAILAGIYRRWEGTE